MNAQDWLPLLGLPANDPKVVAALAANGVTTPVSLGRQTLTTGHDFKSHGLSLGFNSAVSLPGGGEHRPILTTVVMKLIAGKSAKGWALYTGPLPYGLAPTHSKDDLVALLGAPQNLNEDFCSGRWSVEGRELAVAFTDDWARIKQLGVSVPGGH